MYIDAPVEGILFFSDFKQKRKYSLILIKVS
jgi:hypothetical protein